MSNKFACKLSGGPWDGHVYEFDADVQPQEIEMSPELAPEDEPVYRKRNPPGSHHRYRLNEYSGEYDHIPPGEF